MAEAVVLALQTLVLKAPSCSHCRKEGVELKRCTGCKHASYCGAACQNADWKKHKKTCVPLEELRKRLNVAETAPARDWRGMLALEGHMEQLLQGLSPASRCSLLNNFVLSHSVAMSATGSRDHALAAVRLQDRRIELLGMMERFRDQGEAMSNAAEHLLDAQKRQEAEGYFVRARAVGAAHGFFSVECTACLGLGRVAMLEGRHEECLELMRNALAASSLRENESDTMMELEVLRHLTDALFQTRQIDEVEPLVLRFREAAKAQSRRKGGNSCYWESKSIYTSARLHEARGKPQDAGREVRALLDLLRENGAALQHILVYPQNLLEKASTHLKILDPEHGEEELVISVAAERARLTAFMAENRRQ